MLSKSEKILMSLNSKQEPLCQLATTELLPQGDKEKGNTKKITKSLLGLMPYSSSHKRTPWGCRCRAKILNIWANYTATFTFN